MHTDTPHIQAATGCKQLIVDGKPFLVLAGELGNSALSSALYMKDVWSRLAENHLNTVLGSVTWEQVEPQEGQFDFSEVEQVIHDARAHGLRLVLLWFGSWKNGLSTYSPSWVKRDSKRFPRAQLRKADWTLQTADILSLFDTSILDIEKRAFTKLVQKIKEVDEQHSTVIMMQVENEVGILGDSRDAGPSATKIFNAPVPRRFTDTLLEQWDSLHPRLKESLGLFNERHKTKHVSWPETFGRGVKVDELFMAYHYAQYVEALASAGKSIYPLPMFTNVWQNFGPEDKDTSLPIVVGGGSDPGIYPSGGGIVDVLDIWQLFAPSLDLIAPDIYLNQYATTCIKYRHRLQPLFIPEQRRDEYGARRVWEAIGNHGCIGTAPFGIDTVEVEHGHNPYGKHYALLSQVSHFVLAAQGKPNSIRGFYFDEYDSTRNQEDEIIIANFGDWEATIERSFVFGAPSPGCGMIIQLDDSQFLLVGWGFQVAFRSTKPKAIFSGLLSVKEKKVHPITRELITLRLLNGDETRSGKCVMMPSGNPDYGGFPISVTIPAGTGIAEVEPYALLE